MKTRIKKSAESIEINMDGMVDYETQEPLKRELDSIIKEAKTDAVARKIIVNLEKLEFVGSSGISTFIQTLSDFNDRAASRPLYANVKTEFKKMISAFENDDAFAYLDEDSKDRLDQ